MRKKNHIELSKTDRIVDILFSDISDIPEEDVAKIRRWLVDEQGAEEKSEALRAKFESAFVFDSEPRLAPEMWPELARRLGLSEQPARQHSRRTFRLKGLRVAAVLLSVVIMAGLGLWLSRNTEPESTLVAVTIPAGEMQTVSLPDGSRVSSREGMTLRYDEAGFASRRIVQFTGAGVFDVEKVTGEDGVRVPFAVETDGLTVNVLGTVFEMAERDESAVVSLYDGNVEAVSAMGSAKLTPGEYFMIDRSTGEYTTGLVPAAEMAAGGFVPLLRFEESTLGNLVDALEANHKVRFTLAGNIDREAGCYTADFEGLGLDEVLRLLSRIDVDFSFTREGDTIIVTSEVV